MKACAPKTAWCLNLHQGATWLANETAYKRAVGLERENKIDYRVRCRAIHYALPTCTSMYCTSRPQRNGAVRWGRSLDFSRDLSSIEMQELQDTGGGSSPQMRWYQQPRKPMCWFEMVYGCGTYRVWMSDG